MYTLYTNASLHSDINTQRKDTLNIQYITTYIYHQIVVFDS